MIKHERKQWFVDGKVQGALLLRSVWYCVACILLVTMWLLAWRILTGPARPFYTHLDDMWFFFGPALVAAACVIPIVMMYMARFGDRFAGPLFRLRGAMRRLAEGESIEQINFREGDFWREFAEDFNQVAQKLEEARTTLAGLQAQADEQSQSVTSRLRRLQRTSPLPPRRRPARDRPSSASDRDRRRATARTTSVPRPVRRTTSRDSIR